MNRLIIALAISVSVASVACHAEPEARSPTDAKGTEPTHIEIFSAYMPLSKCMDFYLSDETATKALMQRVYESADVERLETNTIDVLGQTNSAVQKAQAPGLDKATRVQALLEGLGQFALADNDNSPLQKAFRAKALAIAMIQLASATKGRCAPSQNLLSWMEQVPHADH